MSVKAKIIRTARNVLLSAVVLLVLLGSAGLTYTWFIGQNSDVSVEESLQTQAAATPAIGPPKPSPKAPASAAIQALTTPVTPGDNAMVTVKTLQTAKCVISVEYDDVASTDSGLTPKVADDWGIVSWTWTVDASAPYGEWPVEVTCTYNKKTAVVKGYLEVAEPER